MQDQLDRYWDGHTYTPKRAMLSANLLLTHAAAALAGHTGPARRDDRALALVHALCDGPAWVTQARRPAPRATSPGWQDGIAGRAASSTSWSTPRSRGR